MDEKQKKTVMLGVGAGLAIVLALISMYLFVIAPSMKSDENSGDTEANAPANAAATSVGPGTYPSPGYGPMTGGAAPGMPGATGAVTGSETEKAVNLPPVERNRKDPFAPLIPPPPPPPDWQVLAAGLPPISIAKPPDRLAASQSVTSDVAMPDVGTEVARRVAGLVTGKRAFALIEQEGQTFIVHPGDVLPPDLAVVERIEPGRVLLRRAGKPIWLPLQASSDTTAVGVAPVTAPGGYPGGGYPGASRPGYTPYGPPGPPGMYRRSGG
jgi:hypothetical protein